MIEDYSSLQAALASRINRADQTDAITDAIDAATMRLSREMRLFDQEALSTVTSATTEYVVLPTDYNGMKLLTMDGARADFYTQEQFENWIATTPYAPNPGYTIVDGQVRLYPVPTVSVPIALRMLYFQRVPELAAGGDTNWVLTNHPDIYLAASMVELLLHMKDEARAQVWEARVQGLLAQAVLASRRRRFPSSVMHIRRG